MSVFKGEGQSDPTSTAFVAAGLVFGVIGGMVIIVQPGFVEGLVSQKGFTDQSAGLIAASEMAGVAVMTILLAIISQRLNWRAGVLAFLLATIAGNIVAMLVDTVSMFALARFVVGLGAGGIVSIGFGMLGMTPHPDRNFGLMVMLAMLYGAVVFYCLPWLFSSFGFAGLLSLFVGLAVLSLLFVPFVPKSGRTFVETDAQAIDLPTNLKWLALAAMLMYFIAQGAVWSYLALIGVSIGVTDSAISQSLTLSQLTGLVGALVPVLVGARFGRFPMLSLGVLAAVVPLSVILFGWTTAIAFFCVVLVYNFGFNLTHPYLLSVMASFDRSGSVVIYAVAMQMTGLAVGPAIGAYIVAENANYTALMFAASVVFLVSLGLLFFPTRAQRRLSQGK